MLTCFFPYCTCVIKPDKDFVTEYFDLATKLHIRACAYDLLGYTNDVNNVSWIDSTCYHLGLSTYDVHMEGEGVRLKVDACGWGRGQAPCGRPHRKLKLESTDVILSSSHAKKLVYFLPHLVFGRNKKWNFFGGVNQ